MATPRSRLASGTALCLFITFGPLAQGALGQTTEPADDTEDTVVLDTIVLSAEDQVRQALGVSNVTARDLERTPVANDISEIVRRMPGVNLTGASATGQRGNQRQIDIRGMGPENTLILIDGRPVLSRNAVRMGRGGERDTRGDSNWVPAEMIERIEVIRGPAAARYGSGAAGGVVNIITKRPTEPTLSFGTHFNSPQSDKEGSDYRANVLFARPIGDSLTLRLTGNYNKSDADDPMINAEADLTTCLDTTTGENDFTNCLPAAGNEGVVNRDVTALLSWEMNAQNTLDFELGYSRQGNIFAGDRQLSSINDILAELANSGAETNRMERKTFALTHRGDYDFGTSNSFFQYERTDNTRNLEATAGGPEGSINNTEQGTIKLENLTAKSEWVLPTTIAGRDSSVTLGAEVRHEKMDDPISIRQTVTGGEIPGTNSDPTARGTKMSQTLLGVYAEANIHWTDALTLTPALRLDHSDHFGFNASPSLNLSYAISDEWTMKVGVARAFKAPNLFQLNPDYVYYTRGNGCPVDFPSLGAGCYVVGNADLDAEKSLNTEIGIAYDDGVALSGTLTAFYNDYRDKIQAGNVPVGSFVTPGGTTAQYFQWVNIPKAVVAGLEGSVSYDISDTLNVATNFTYMARSENKETGDPLSLVPKYTVNASLNWQATDKLSVTPSLTHYGKIDSPDYNPITGATLANPEPRGAYTIANIAFHYEVSEKVRLSAGITNLFNKQILREGSTTSAGANTFNEPGRAFYVGLNATF